MVNIDEVKCWTCCLNVCNVVRNVLMFTISYMAGRSRPQYVKAIEEEGPCGQRGPRSRSCHQNRVHLWRHQVHIWCRTWILVGRDIQADHTPRGAWYGLGRRRHLCQHRDIFTDKDCHQTRALPMLWSDWLDSSLSRCNHDDPGEYWKIGLCCL